jgi:hypothetical protein
MPKFRISAHGEWFYTDVVEADTLDEARAVMLEAIRNKTLPPIHGPGVTWLETHRVIANGVTEQP